MLGFLSAAPPAVFGGRAGKDIIQRRVEFRFGLTPAELAAIIPFAMRQPALVLAAVLALAPAASAQGGKVMDPTRLLPREIAGWTAAAGSDRTFTRSNIFDYLNGGGELYLAFDFKSLFVREYADGRGQTLVVEVYDMGKPADAFGIFSQDRDGGPTDVGQGGLYGAGLLRFWKGSLFVRILAEKETEESKRILFALAARISAAWPKTGQPPALLDRLPGEGLDKSSASYFHRQVSLNSHYYLADENVLGLDAGTEAVLAWYRLPRGRALLLICRYPRAAGAAGAFRALCGSFFADPCKGTPGRHIEKTENDDYTGARLAGTYLALVFEAPDAAACGALLEAADKRIKGGTPWKRKSR